MGYVFSFFEKTLANFKAFFLGVSRGKFTKPQKQEKTEKDSVVYMDHEEKKFQSQIQEKQKKFQQFLDPFYKNFFFKKRGENFLDFL
jgi:hypothetical protein